MKTITSRQKKLSPEAVRRKRAAIENKYRNSITNAENARRVALLALQAVCPHVNSESGNGGSLDYYFDCKDCGKG